MRNTLTDLNDHLIAQIEKISDDDLTDENLLREIKRSDALCQVAKMIVENGSLALKVHQYATDFQLDDQHLPKMLQHKNGVRQISRK